MGNNSGNFFNGTRCRGHVDLVFLKEREAKKRTKEEGMNPEIVKAKEIHGLRAVAISASTIWSMTLLQLFGIGPKMHVLCGKCERWFAGRIMMVNRPRLKCTFCDAINILDIVLN